ncbi:MAG: PadR family transcriptional regulator [Allosphingosinicella sp.]
MDPSRRKEIELRHGIGDPAPFSAWRQAAGAVADIFTGGGIGLDGPGRAHGGGGRRGRMFGPGELRLLFLKLLAGAPRHGYELIKAVEELTGGAYAPSPGTVYPTLQLLADEGAIAERQDEDSSRKAYAATAQGTDELDAREAEVLALMQRLAGVAHERRAGTHLQVQRAMENLRNALRLQRHRNALKGETLDAIVDLIDETARRIARM